LILIDTSAWVEFLRGTDSDVCKEVYRLVDSEIAITDPISMKVLAGARNDRHLRELRGLLARASLLKCESVDFDHAATLFRTCRKSGETVRRLTDCLIGAVAIRHELPILHADGDFDALGRWTTLIIHSPQLGPNR
ncbi:MAG: type II toxin-antitoxin system VapC family toxin, partial [Candidatus Dormibacteraceae bacterium]